MMFPREQLARILSSVMLKVVVLLLIGAARVSMAVGVEPIGTTMCHGGTLPTDPPCYCNPNQKPPPMCVYNGGGHPPQPCPQCGTSNCTCPLAPTPTPPTPTPPTPTPPTPPSPGPTPPGPGPTPPPTPPVWPPKPSPPGPVRPGMIYNGTCLAGGQETGGDCNAMQTGTFKEATTYDLCFAKIAKCKYGNYATFNQGPDGCGWHQTCPTIGTPQFCVDCHLKANGSCAALPGRCPGFIQFITKVIRMGPPAPAPLPNFTCTTGASPSPAPSPSPPTPPPPATGTPWGHVGPWCVL